jgi:threonine/homoserine/homoserine lactone efflux protein
MSATLWILYLTAALTATLIPGPAALLAVSNSMAFGWRRVAYSSLGNILGLLVVASLALAGVGTLLRASRLAFALLKVAGAGYLMWLGLRQWRSGSSVIPLQDPSGPAARPAGRIFLKGLLVALTNPKAILFFSALFPQFLRLDRPLAPQFLVLVSVFMGLSFTVLMGYGLAAHAIRAWCSDAARRTGFNRLTGGCFLVLGFGLLLSLRR